MKIFVISLKRSWKRRHDVESELQRQGLEFEFIDAIDGLELTERQIDGSFDRAVIERHPEHFTRGALGCALSHQVALRKVVEAGYPHTLILEDDICIAHPDLGSLLDRLQSTIASGEIALLHYMTFEPLKLSVDGALDLGDRTALYRPIDFRSVNSAAAYVVTAESARSFLSATNPIRLTSDSWHDYSGIGAFGSLRFVYPMPISVRGAKSTIAAASQSRLRAWVGEFVDNYRIQPFHDLFKRFRISSVEERSQVELVGPIPENSEKKNERWNNQELR